MNLDTTGEFLNVKPSFKAPTPQEKIQAERLFLMDHLHFLYGHRKTIMANPQMYFAPVEVGHNLAYSGRSGFRNATLGVVMKWLEISPYAKDFDENGEIALLGWMAGSPLTGCNKCSFVRKDGTSYDKPIKRCHAFWYTWRAFVHVNSRFAKLRETVEVEPYTLQEVIGKLSRR